MPGYEPFLLCDFHVHTRWSDGQLSLREVVDLYGSTGKFDLIAITDHILMKSDVFARIGRMATLGQRRFGLSEDAFEDYLADVKSEAARARELYDMLVIPGAEITQNNLRGKKNSHIIALDIAEYISADQSARAILNEIRRQGALSIACHPHHRTTRRVEVSTIPSSPAATFTSRNTCTRGRHWFGPRRTGPRSGKPFAPTWTSP